MKTKTYITAAALLAAGAVFANAADSTVLTTTFSNAAQSSATSVALTNTWASDLSLTSTVSASVTSLTTSSLQIAESSSVSDVSLQTSGAAGMTATFFSPNNNVGNSTGWEATFSYSNVSDLLSISSITLNMGFFSSAGAWQTTNATWNGNLEMTAVIKDSNGNTLGTLTGTWANPKGNGSNTSEDVALSISTENLSSINLTNVDAFTLVLSTNDNQDSGGFFGLNSVSFAGTAIPEPSAFGLLAGLGALALAGTRRRRK